MASANHLSWLSKWQADRILSQRPINPRKKGLAYLDFLGSEKIEEAHECLQQSVQQRGDNSKIIVLVKLVDTSYEMYKMNPGLYETEFLADYHLARKYLEKLATDPNYKNAETAKEQKQYVDGIFENSGISSKQ